jgi:hypothetical protein
MLQLVQELFDHIITLLDLRELFAFRLTCRQFELRSRMIFGEKAFGTITVNFTDVNLQWVHEIARHEVFRRGVRTLYIGRWHHKKSVVPAMHLKNMPFARRRPYDEDSYSLGLGGHWPRQGERGQRGEMGSLDPSCESVTKFRSDVARFVNCQTLIITEDHCHIYHWKGAEDYLLPLDAVELLLQVLGLPNAPPIRSFQVFSFSFSENFRDSQVCLATTSLSPIHLVRVTG